jgi:hypothetical protein
MVALGMKFQHEFWRGQAIQATEALDSHHLKFLGQPPPQHAGTLKAGAKTVQTEKEMLAWTLFSISSFLLAVNTK